MHFYREINHHNKTFLLRLQINQRLAKLKWYTNRAMVTSHEVHWRGRIPSHFFNIILIECISLPVDIFDTFFFHVQNGMEIDDGPMVFI
jgi:hypothetical protein